LHIPGDLNRLISCTPVFNKEGLLEKVIHLATDITERKRAEEALRRNEGLLRAVLDSIPDLIWLKDPNGISLACDPMLERLLGASAERILGKTDYAFLDQEQADCLRAHDHKTGTIAAGKPCRNEEWITLADNGQRLLLDTLKTPMYDAKGALVGVLGIGRDITEQNRLQSQLAGAQRMESIGRMAGGVAHDFNNILVIIIGYDELALEKSIKAGRCMDIFSKFLMPA
jgi:PAS domain S-box-containing protein